MRILFTTSNAFIPDHISGQNRTLLELAARLAQMGHEPVVLAATASPRGRTTLFCDRNHGFRLFRAEHPFKHLVALCATLQPDMTVIADGHYEGFMRELKPLGGPVAAWFFQAEPHLFLHRAPDDGVLCMASSRFVAGRLRSLFGIDAEILPPFIDAARYQRAGRGKRVLFVNPVRQKGVEVAFTLAEQRPNLPFTFVESWGLSEQWRQTCFERASRCGNIEWQPKTVDMSPALAQTRLLLVPRCSEEGFCRLVTEAQLGGIPVLASDRGHLAENVGPGGTVLDMDAQVATWLDPLDRYFSDDDYYAQASERARAHADRAELHEQTIAERFLNLLQAHISRLGVRRFGGRRA